MNLEDCFVSVNAPLTRVEKDRILRSYRTMNGVLHSARAYGRYFAADDIKDDAVIQAQMYSLRASVLAVEDARERLFLYHYYIKGNTLLFQNTINKDYLDIAVSADHSVKESCVIIDVTD